MKRRIALLISGCALVAVVASCLVRQVPPTAPDADGVPAVPAAVYGPVAPAGGEANKLNAPKTETTNRSGSATGASSLETSAVRRRQLTRSGTIVLLVPDISRALGSVRSLSVAEAATLTSLDDEHPPAGGGAREASLTLSVPADRFEATLDRLAGLGGVRSRSVTAEDVTDQLVDDEARLRNLRRTEADMLQIMDRSGRIAEVLDVENQLSSVRDQIERLDAERASVAGRVAYSTIAVTLTTDATAPAAEPSASSRLGEAWRAALADVREFSLALAARLFVLVAFAPYWILAVALVAGGSAVAGALRRGRPHARTLTASAE